MARSIYLLLINISAIISLASLLYAAEMTEDYRIGAEDVIQIKVYDQADLSVTVKVSPDGYIPFPLLGRIKAEGFTGRELEKDVEARLLADYLKNPQVSILIKEYRSRKIYVLGGVASPGMYELTKTITLLEAISRAGGLSNNAARHAVISRSKKGNKSGAIEEPLKIDLKRLLDEGDTSLNVNIHDGDVVQIPNANSYFVFGEVKSPGLYSIDKDLTILQAVTRAGGFTKIAAPSRTKVIRGKDGAEETINVDISDIIKGDKEKDIYIKADDIVVIPESFF
ncbi:MAG: polysaccharide biosynthesis/export family protein [bacterium]|nr:polysaccharide biosynthesis/export family protein [bacterium]